MLATVPPSLWSRWRNGTLSESAWQMRLDAIPRWCGILLRIFQQMKTHHVMLVTGGLCDQPIRWMTAFDIIEDEMRKLQDEQQANVTAMEKAKRAQGLR